MGRVPHYSGAVSGGSGGGIFFSPSYDVLKLTYLCVASLRAERTNPLFFAGLEKRVKTEALENFYSAHVPVCTAYVQ